MSIPVPQTRKFASQVRGVTPVPSSVTPVPSSESSPKPDMKAWIRQEIGEAVAKSLIKINEQIKAEVTCQVNIYCKSVFSSDDEHFSVIEQPEDEFLVEPMPPEQPKLERQ